MDLSVALTPVASRVITQFSRGVTARVRVNAPNRAADASSVKHWSDVAGLAAAPVLTEDLGAERALKVWGADKIVHMEATIALPAGVSIEPKDFGLQLVGGTRDGSRYLIVGVRVDDTSRVASLALQRTNDLLGLP